MLDDRDHRSIGQRQQLFHLQEEAPGSVFWHPRGWALYRALEEALRRELQRQGYREVRSPQVLDERIWSRSGHWEHFREGMLEVRAGDAGGGRELALKPVSCPGHLQIARKLGLSASALPLRLAELGLCHRNEPSGALHGLFRLRQFCQDDGHIFCAEDQVNEEVGRFCASVRRFYAAFGFEGFDVAFSSRPEQRVGSEEVWDRAEASLMAAAREAGLSPRLQPGAGAFYGPKLELGLRDRAGRLWQCGTIQLDLILPERFDASYASPSGAPRRPAMLHRAILGSLERFIGILLEHHQGALPPWIAPQQFVVASVLDAPPAYALEVAERLRGAGLRGEVDLRDVSLSDKVQDAARAGVPFLIAAGAREAAARSASVRGRNGKLRAFPLEQGVAQLAAECAAPL